MNLHFNRFLQLTDPNDWKNLYSEEMKKLDQLYQEEERLYYQMYAHGKETQRLEEIQKIKHELMTNEALIENISSWKVRFKEDHVWSRRLDVFLAKMKQESLDCHPKLVEIQHNLQSKLLESKFQVDGKEYSLGSVHSNIMENPDRNLRKKLFLGAKRIGEEHEDLFRKLLQTRNKLAKQHGFENYYYFRCQLKEIDIEAYFSQMNVLIEKLGESSTYWNTRIKEKFGWETIHLYDQYYSTFNFHHLEGEYFNAGRMEEVLEDVVNSLGLDIKQIPISIESIEIPYGGFCINVNPNELKLVVNKRNSYSAFLSGIHELGHVIDGYYCSFDYPELYRFYSSIAAESVAELFQTIITEKEFLRKNFNIQEEEYTRIEEMNHLLDLNMVKMNYYYSLVEYELYKNPERKFQEIANDCYRYVFGFEGEAFHPASEMFYIENPAFFQDYNFALASRDMIRTKYKIKSLYGNRKAFQDIIEVYIKPGQLYSWQERIESLCGEPHSFNCLEESLIYNSGEHEK